MKKITKSLTCDINFKYIYKKKKKRESKLDRNYFDDICLKIKNKLYLKNICIITFFFFQYDSTVAMIELVAIREEEIHL